MKANELKVELQKLYADASKHSVYQNVPDFVSAELGYTESIDEGWRSDRPRLAYLIASRTPAPGERWLDFGANTGFFTLSLAHLFPQTAFTAVEANPNHASFIKRIAEVFEMRNLRVIGRPIAIDDLVTVPPHDVLLHLNVLHHAGADFDQGHVTNQNDFLAYAQVYLQRLQACTHTLVLQIGTNLWGNKAAPIIDYRSDVAKYGLLSGLLTRSGWRIDDVAYAAWRERQSIQYQSLGDAIKGIDFANPPASRQLQAAMDKFGLGKHVGEFYRRPLFFCSPAATRASSP